MSKKEGAEAEEKAEQAEAKAEQHEAKKQKKSFAGFCCKNMALTVIAVLVVGLIIGALAGHFGVPNGNCLAALPAASTGPDTSALQLKVEAYLASLVEAQGVTAKVTSITSVNDGLFQADFTLEQDGQEQEMSAYITKDGSTMVMGEEYYNIFFLDKPLPEPVEPEPTFSYKDIEPQESAMLEAFIVSNCPYGLQMQRILAPVATGLAANIKVRYIGAVEGGKITSMHGDAEAQENLRQICIREEEAGKYWHYVSEYMKKGDSEAALTAAGIDKAKLSTCMTDASKGLAYAQEDFDIADLFGIGSSPTLLLNGMPADEFEFGAGNGASGGERSAENVKNLLCHGFITKPAACSTTLAKDNASISFSEQYSGGSTSGGSC